MKRVVAPLRARLRQLTLARLGIWALNASLFTLCCYITAGLASAWLGDRLAVDAAAQPAASTSATESGRAWTDRQAILERNLFQVSTLLPAATEAAAPPPKIEDEKLQATRLPLRLLGTVASPEANAAYAAVEDQQTRRQSVVRVGEALQGDATVLRIERRRIVIQNGANREELALDDEKELRIQEARRVARDSRTTGPVAEGLRERIQKLSETTFSKSPKKAEAAGRDPQPLADAQVAPRYEQGRVTGVAVSAIDGSSLFEQIGIEEGDTVVQVNGISVTGAQDSVAALRELTEASEFQVTVIGADGQARTLTHALDSD